MASFSTWAEAVVLLTLCLISTAAAAVAEGSFNCRARATCHALVDYSAVNDTTLAGVKALFGVKKLYSLLGANNLPTSTPPNNRSHEADDPAPLPLQLLRSRRPRRFQQGPPLHRQGRRHSGQHRQADLLGARDVGGNRSRQQHIEPEFDTGEPDATDSVAVQLQRGERDEGGALRTLGVWEHRGGHRPEVRYDGGDLVGAQRHGQRLRSSSWSSA